MLTASNPLVDIGMAAKGRAFYVQLGKRIAERRRALDITQAQLAETLGIAQQTMAHYEGGVARIAVDSLRTLAQKLDISIEELVDDAGPKRTSKRGPTPKIQQQLERVNALPKPDQRAVMRLLDSMLAQAGR